MCRITNRYKQIFQNQAISLCFSFVFVTVWSGLRLSLVSVLYVDTVSTGCPHGVD
jgi:hypothetical protein